jgi:DME family drug/metabolite transporter
MPRLEILAAALLFSTAGAAIKAVSLTSWQIASFRSGIATLAVLVLLPGSRSGLTWRAALVGIFYAATMILFVTANRMTTAANAIFLQATAPLYLLAAAPWILDERPSRRDIAFMGVLALGMSLFFVGIDAPKVTAPAPMLGNLLSAASALCWAFTVLGIRWLGSSPRAPNSTGPSHESMAAVLFGNLFAFLACLPFALPVGPAPAVDWIILAYLGVFQIGLAYMFLTRGMAHVPALEASLLLLLEDAANPIWVWLFHGEVPGVWALAGGGIIMTATAVKAWVDAPRRPAIDLGETGMVGD